MSVTATARPVVVGIDGSGRAEQILEWAAAEAVVCRAPLHVVTVWTWDGQATAGPSARRPDRSTARPGGWARQVQETLVARVLARFGNQAPPISVEVTMGDPATQLIERSCHAELLVVGADSTDHEHGSRTVARVCVQHAGCPVVVVPAEGALAHPAVPRQCPPDGTTRLSAD
ncbi:MAG TPA: universal stress protein [Kineosporiaceae bacterium]|nr:universal stress protein [Kineosporiaceae bacterium]